MLLTGFFKMGKYFPTKYFEGKVYRSQYVAQADLKFKILFP